MKILIVGAGIGGLSLASFLKDSEIKYDIVEKAPDWTHQGYSISLWNNGRYILNKLGLAETFDSNSTPVQNYYIRDGQGRLLKDYNLKDFYSSYGISLGIVKRADLHDWLILGIDASSVRMGVSIENIVQEENGITVSFTDGSMGTYDLVVGADGIQSKVRDLVFHTEIKKATNWRTWYMWVDNAYKTKSAVTEYIAPGEFVSFFDSGDKTLAIMTASTDSSVWDDPKDRIDRLKKNFKDESAVASHMFDSLKNEDIKPADLIHISLNSWVKNQVVLIGDAAHGFEPYGGIGGSMALEDGYVLASQLLRVSPDFSITKALKVYENKRKKRVELAMRLTAKMKAFALIRSPLFRKIVDILIPFIPEKYFVKDYHTLMREEV